ncbi:MAG: MATE family efflux transporter [Ruminococcus sp.]|nr:MATE family efflux transporter [Ruminococcus sp.]
MKETFFYKHNPIVKKVFLTMLAPTILMNLTTAIGSMADTVIIGQYLDDLSLSVVTFALPVFMAINILAALFSVGGCIAMSIDSGKGMKNDANRDFSISLELMAIASVMFVLAGVFFSHTITGLLGAEKDVFDLVETYVRIILIGGPVFIFNIGLAFFVRNDGRPTLSMIGMFSSIISDIILNFVFVGVMGMGVSGAAYSTVIGNLVSILILMTHFISRKNTLKFRFAFDSTAIRIIKNGGSSALNFVYQFITILIMNHLLASLAGTSGIVIYTVVFNLTTVSLSVFEGISQTIQPMVSTYYGENSFKNIKETLYLAFITILLICGTVTVLMELFPQVVPVVFGVDDPGLVRQSAQAVRIYSTSMIVTTVNVVIGYYLQSIEQSLLSAILISLRSFVVFLIATFTLGYLFKMNGIWSAYIVSETLSLVIGVILIKAKQRRLENVNILLLDKEICTAVETYTCNVKKDSFADFKEYVVSKLKNSESISDHSLKATLLHLCEIEKNLTNKNSSYIEVEVNNKDNKVIVRDNCSNGKINIEGYNLNESSSYSPALGFNRLCLEGD